MPGRRFPPPLKNTPMLGFIARGQQRAAARVCHIIEGTLDPGPILIAHRLWF